MIYCNAQKLYIVQLRLIYTLTKSTAHKNSNFKTIYALSKHALKIINKYCPNASLAQPSSYYGIKKI